MEAQPRFLQGVYDFMGEGLAKSFPLSAEMSYAVPPGKRAQLIYFRGGNSSGELIYLVLIRDGRPMRFFPIGAKATAHVQLAVVEDLMTDTRIDVLVAAPAGCSGTVVVDIGLLEL